MKELKEFLVKVEKSWGWIWIKKNSTGIMVILALVGLLIGIPQCFKRSEETDMSKIPKVKIKSVSYKSHLYQESPTSQSEALNFVILIRNDGDTKAYDVQIRKKVLGLVGGTYDALSIPALRTLYTIAPFDLKPRQAIADTIFIDDSPANMQKVMSGEKSITLEYEIHYYGDRNKKNGPFVYKYKISSNKDIFENEKAEQSTDFKIKP